MSGLSSCEGELAGAKKKNPTTPVLMEDSQCMNSNKVVFLCVPFLMCLQCRYFMTTSCLPRVVFLFVRISIPLPCWVHNMGTKEKPRRLYRPLVVSCSTCNATLLYFIEVVVFSLYMLSVDDKNNKNVGAPH